MRHGAHARKVFMLICLMHALDIIDRDFLRVFLPLSCFGQRQKGQGR